VKQNRIYIVLYLHTTKKAASGQSAVEIPPKVEWIALGGEGGKQRWKPTQLGPEAHPRPSFFLAIFQSQGKNRWNKVDTLYQSSHTYKCIYEIEPNLRIFRSSWSNFRVQTPRHTSWLKDDPLHPPSRSHLTSGFGDCRGRFFTDTWLLRGTRGQAALERRRSLWVYMFSLMSKV